VVFPTWKQIYRSAHRDLEAGFITADDVVDDAVPLGLERGHVPVAIRVLLDLCAAHTLDISMRILMEAQPTPWLCRCTTSAKKGTDIC